MLIVKGICKATVAPDLIVLNITLEVTEMPLAIIGDAVGSGAI